MKHPPGPYHHYADRFQPRACAWSAIYICTQDGRASKACSRTAGCVLSKLNLTQIITIIFRVKGEIFEKGEGRILGPLGATPEEKVCYGLCCLLFLIRPLCLLLPAAIASLAITVLSGRGNHSATMEQLDGTPGYEKE